MSAPPRVTQWTQLVATQLPPLSRPQARVLALWSLGLVLARSCGRTAVSVFVANRQERQEHTVRQQLREWCYEAPAKRGSQRQALAVETCLAPLLRWVLHRWHGNQLALALDTTTLGDRFAGLAISVRYRGCAIPGAWAVLPATAQGAWKAEWRRLLQQGPTTVPATMTVIVLADRGLYARWLFRAMVHRGWHPLLRVNAGGLFRPQDGARWRSLASFAPSGQPLARHRHGVQDPPAALHAAGLLGTRPGGAVAVGDRSAASCQHGGVVRLARLDQAGLQADQTRWLAVAAHPHDARAGPPGCGWRWRWPPCGW